VDTGKARLNRWLFSANPKAVIGLCLRGAVALWWIFILLDTTREEQRHCYYLHLPNSFFNADSLAGRQNGAAYWNLSRGSVGWINNERCYYYPQGMSFIS
jgi:hypothetical protein